MNNPLTGERQDVYNWFYEATEGVKIEFDSEEVFLFEEDDAELKETVRDIREILKMGGLTMDDRTARVIAAKAFCDAANIRVFDYEETGGGGYEDD